MYLHVMRVVVGNASNYIHCTHRDHEVYDAIFQPELQSTKCSFFMLGSFYLEGVDFRARRVVRSALTNSSFRM